MTLSKKFSDFYKTGKPRFSFEVFPTKTPEGSENLLVVLKNLKKFDPAFVSVTYGAMGSTQDLTKDLSIRIQKEVGTPTAFHFTCVGSNRDSVQAYVDTLKKEGLSLIVALRGDPPQGHQSFTPPVNGFRYANELVAYLKNLDGFSLAVAGYPEGHIEAPSKEADLLNLKRKVDAGADIVITQLFFDNRDYFDFVEKAEKAGIRTPIIPGLMPIQSLKQVEKISSLCGAKIPKPLHQRLLSAAEKDDTQGLTQIGIEQTLQQSQELLAAKVPGIHFYTLNKEEAISQVIDSL